MDFNVRSTGKSVKILQENNTNDVSTWDTQLFIVSAISFGVDVTLPIYISYFHGNE